MGRISQSNVSFLTGVPFDKSYAHTRWLNSRSEQYSYFKSFEKFSRVEFNYVKIRGKNYVQLSEQVEDVMACNYLMFKNSDYSGKWFFAFITNVEHRGKGVTRVEFEIDVLQTWRFDISFKQSFVAREHENPSNNWNVIPEGLAIGNEYETVKQWDIKPYPFYFFVICVKERFDLDYESDLYDGSFYSSPDTLSYYVIPVPYAIEGEGPVPDYKFTDAMGNYHSSTEQDIRRLFHELKGNEKAPKNIVSMFLTDYLPIDIVEESSFHYRLRYTVQTTLNPGADKKSYVYCILSRPKFLPIMERRVGNVFSEINESASKLRYYPYTIIEYSDGRGNVVNYKPEGLRHNNGNIDLRILGGIHFYNNVAYALDFYNNNRKLTRAELLSNALINTDPQDISVLDDKTTAYKQGAKNSLEAQRQTWETDRFYARATNITRGVTSAANIAGTASSGNKNPSAYIDDVGNTVQSFTNYMQAGEDYQNKINQQHAMLEDIGNMPPSLAKQGSNVSLSAGNNVLGVRVSIKRARPEYLDRARNYMHMFGTKTNQLKVPNLHTRANWNYIQTTMCNIQSNFYNDDIIKIRQIFDNGITLWHTNDIYNYAKTNEVI